MTRSPSSLPAHRQSAATIRPRGFALRAALAGVLVVGLGACAGSGGGQPKPKASPTLAPFDIELAGSTATLHMVPIPAGQATIADATAPGGHREVPVGPFWMSETEVTWDLFDIYVYRLDETDPDKPAGVDAISRPSKPYLPPDRGFGHAGYPAISIAHDAATQFCVWLSAKTGRHFRLATTTEWGYACAAGGAAPSAPIDDRAWHSGNSDNKTHPVAQKQPNAFGLYDMLGNVVEWTEGPDGKPITCGGGYVDAPETLNCDIRTAYSRSWQSRDPQIPKSKWWLSDGPFVGFRIICDPEAPAGGRP